MTAVGAPAQGGHSRARGAASRPAGREHVQVIVERARNVSVRAMFMNAIAAALIAVGAYLVLFLQEQVALLQPPPGGSSVVHPPAAVFYSRRVVTRGEVIAAAVHVHEGRVQRVVPCDAPPRSDRVIDYSDFVISPGLVDIHVHLNEPGREAWEGFDSGTRAAAAGGVTSLVDMPLNSAPAVVDAESFDLKLDAARGKLHVDVAFWGGLVPSNARNPAALGRLLDRGVVGLKAFMSPSGIDDFQRVDEDDLRSAIRTLERHQVPLMAHAELPSPVVEDPGADPRKYATYLATRPRKWERDAIEMLAKLASRTGGGIHVAHVSDADSLETIAEARRSGRRITAETCTHYLSFAAEEIPDGDTLFKCAPPIREAENRERLWEAVKNGTISVISSDHSPAPPAEKLVEEGDFLRAWGGIAGLQFSLPATWTEASRRNVSLATLADVWSSRPAWVAGLGSKGSIAPGKDADFVVWDPDAEVLVGDDGADGWPVEHKHPTTPWRGRRLRGRVISTFLRGELVYERRPTDGAHEHRAEGPYGRTMRRT